MPALGVQETHHRVRVVVDLGGLSDPLQGGVLQAALDLLCGLQSSTSQTFRVHKPLHQAHLCST